MAKTKEQKKEIIENLKEKVSRQKAMVFADFKGLKVKDLSKLRNKLKLADCQLLAVKKTLANLVFKEKELKVDFGKTEAGLPADEAGQLAVVFGFQDELAMAKIVYQFSQENQNFKILGGFFEEKIRGSEEVISLAQIPSKDELLAKLVGSLSAPISNFVYALQYNLKGLINVLAKAKT